MWELLYGKQMKSALPMVFSPPTFSTYYGKQLAKVHTPCRWINRVISWHHLLVGSPSKSRMTSNRLVGPQVTEELDSGCRRSSGCIICYMGWGQPRWLLWYQSPPRESRSRKGPGRWRLQLMKQQPQGKLHIGKKKPQNLFPNQESLHCSLYGNPCENKYIHQISPR